MRPSLPWSAAGTRSDYRRPRQSFPQPRSPPSDRGRLLTAAVRPHERGLVHEGGRSMTHTVTSALNHSYSRRARRAGVLLMYLSSPLILLGPVAVTWHGAGWALMALAVVGFL